MGLMSDDGNESAVPPMLAELVGMPSATAVDEGRPQRRQRPRRARARGRRPRSRRPPDAVRSSRCSRASTRSATRRSRASWPRRRSRSTSRPAADLGVADAVGAGGAKSKIEKIYAPPKGEGAEILSGSTDDVVAGLDQQDQGARAPLARLRKEETAMSASSSSLRSRRARSAKPATSWFRSPRKSAETSRAS